MKLYHRLRTWVMIGLMIGAVFLGSLMAWYYDGRQLQGEAWRDHAIQEKQKYEEMLQEPKLREENRARIQERIAIYNYHLEHNIRITDGTMWDGMNNCADLIVLITLFTVIIAGDSMASEFSTGSIKLLLIRPASRLKILISKYVSMIMFGLLLLVILFIASILVNGALFGFGLMNLPLVSADTAGHIVEDSMMANLWKMYLLNGVSTIMFVTMAFMISTAFRSSAMAIGFSIFALFAGVILMEFLQRYAWSKYMLFANIDLSQYLNGRPYQEGMTFSFSLAVLAAYFVIFNLVAWLVFTRRDVNA
jgi:ABC-2 type transport system permease protein